MLKSTSVSSVFFCSLPLDSSSLLLLLEPDVLELQWAGDEANLAALFHQPADPPVVVELLRGDNKNTRKKGMLLSHGVQILERATQSHTVALDVVK